MPGHCVVVIFPSIHSCLVYLLVLVLLAPLLCDENIGHCLGLLLAKMIVTTVICFYRSKGSRSMYLLLLRCCWMFDGKCLGASNSGRQCGIHSVRLLRAKKKDSLRVMAIGYPYKTNIFQYLFWGFTSWETVHTAKSER